MRHVNQSQLVEGTAGLEICDEDLESKLPKINTGSTEDLNKKGGKGGKRGRGKSKFGKRGKGGATESKDDEGSVEADNGKQGTELADKDGPTPDDQSTAAKPHTLNES